MLIFGEIFEFYNIFNDIKRFYITFLHLGNYASYHGNMPCIAKWMPNSDSAQKITSSHIFLPKNIDVNSAFFLADIYLIAPKYLKISCLNLKHNQFFTLDI